QPVVAYMIAVLLLRHICRRTRLTYLAESARAVLSNLHFNDTSTPGTYTLSYTTLFRSSRLACRGTRMRGESDFPKSAGRKIRFRSEEHTSELQSRGHLVCRLLLEKKNRSLFLLCRYWVRSRVMDCYLL